MTLVGGQNTLLILPLPEELLSDEVKKALTKLQDTVEEKHMKTSGFSASWLDENSLRESPSYRNMYFED